MTRSVFAVMIGAFALGCADPELAKKVADLEAKVAELEKRPAAPAGPAAPANSEEEAAAAELLKQVSSAVEASNYEEAKTKLQELKTKYPNTRATKAAARMEAEIMVVGSKVSDLKVEKWFQGNQATLAEGTTLLVFWEVWCPHCKREVPKMTEVFDKYKGQGLNVVGLTKQTRDVTEQQVVDFIAENKVTYPIAKEQGDEMSKAFNVSGIPAAAVVKNGTVVWRGHPARLDDAKISGWLAN